MIQEGEPFNFEARNPKPKFSRRVIGDVYSLDIELDEGLWEQMKEVPRGAILSGKLYWTLGDDPEVVKKAEKKLKGEWGEFWRGMCAKGILSSLDLRQVLNADAADEKGTKQALYDLFEVTSLSQIHPAEFSRWAAENQLNVIVMMADEVARGMER